MTRRDLVALVLAVTAATVAIAAPAHADRACRLIVDATNDDYVLRDAGPSGASTGSLDIVSADIASDRARVTAVIRVRQLVLPDPGAASGIGYDVFFTVDDVPFGLHADRTADGSTRFWVVTEGELGEGSGLIIGYVDGVFDEDASEVRITASRRVFAEKRRLRDGDVLHDLAAVTYRSSGMSRLPVSPFPDPYGFTVSADADRAGTDATYRVGSPSCVRVGF